MTDKCKHCGEPIAIRNPSGHCDHLFWPENLSAAALVANGLAPDADDPIDRAALERAIAEAISAEREACAKIADEHSAWTRSYGAEEACEMVAKAIRARGDQ